MSDHHPGKSLCIQYGLPVSEFVAELEAFKINKGIDVVEMSHLGKIEEALRKKATTAANHVCIEVKYTDFALMLN